MAASGDRQIELALMPPPALLPAPLPAPSIAPAVVPAPAAAVAAPAAAIAAPAAATAAPAATVAAVEPLGAETLVVLTLEGVVPEVIARVGRETKLRPGDAAAFMVDTVAMHVFDTMTTQAIPRGHDGGRG